MCTVYFSRIFVQNQCKCDAFLCCSLTSAFFLLLLLVDIHCISLVNTWTCLNLIQLLSCTRFITSRIKNEKKKKEEIYQLKANNNNNNRKEQRFFPRAPFTQRHIVFVDVLFYFILFLCACYLSSIRIQHSFASSMFIACLSSNTSTIIVLCQQNNRINWFAQRLTLPAHAHTLTHKTYDNDAHRPNKSNR